MNLRFFHALLILLSAAVCVLFGIYCLSRHLPGDGMALPVAGITSFVLSACLIAYDSWFLRKTRTLR